MANVEIDPGKALDYLPTGIALVSVAANGKSNVMTATRAICVSSKPPLMAVSIAADRFTYGAIKAAGEFVINVAAADQSELASKAGKVSGRDVDKFAELAIPTRPADKVESPLIDGCASSMECKLVNAIELGDRTLFVGEVVALHVDDQKTAVGRLQGKYRDLGSQI